MATNQLVLLNAALAKLERSARMYLILRDFIFSTFCPGVSVVKNCMPITSCAIARLI